MSRKNKAATAGALYYDTNARSTRFQAEESIKNTAGRIAIMKIAGSKDWPLSRRVNWIQAFDKRKCEADAPGSDTTQPENGTPARE